MTESTTTRPVENEGTERLDVILSDPARARAYIEWLRAEKRRLEDNCDRLVGTNYLLEQRSLRLTRLCVTNHRLLETLEHDKIIQAIAEVVITIIGSERFAVYEADDAGREMRLVASEGLDAAELASISTTQGIIARTIGSGEVYICDYNAATFRPVPRPVGPISDDQLIVCVPLRAAGKMMGVIAVYGLLRHKPGLEHGDLDVLRLLSSQAATALYCCRLHERLSPGE